MFKTTLAIAVALGLLVGTFVVAANAASPGGVQTGAASAILNSSLSMPSLSKGLAKQPKNGAYCNGTAEKQHPKGAKLAAQVVEMLTEQPSEDPAAEPPDPETIYKDIMEKFCNEGYGFGEIKLAYKIAVKAGVDVTEVFAKRADGVGWGQIKQDYGLIGKDKSKGGSTGTGTGTGTGKGNGNGNGNGKDHGNGNGKGNGKGGGKKP